MFTKNVLTSSIQGAGFEVEYLVIAGGGGGASAYGGGGAGGYRTGTGIFNVGAAYTVTVGAGGTGDAPAGPLGSQGGDGGDSTFFNTTSTGGGGGSSYDPSSTGRSGGSGGGAGYTASGGVGGSGNTPATTPSQGNDGGGSSGSSPYYGGGGGGGAGAVGGTGTSTNGGDGGDGVSSTITGANVYRAGGGGAGNYTASNGGSGGAGGGGNAGSPGVAGVAGTANTGSGGGGGHAGSSGVGAWTGGGAGGSGVVIIKVPRKIIAEFSAGVVYNYIPVDGFHVYEITAAGLSDTVTFSDGSDIPVTIDNSLRFNDDDSAYLTRTPASAGNRQKFTWSGWIKRATLGTDQFVFGANSGLNVDGGFVITSSNTLGFNISGNVYNKYTSAVFRDPSAWYHVVIQFDTTQAAAENRIRIYVNGKEETDYTTQNSGLPPLNTSTNYLNTATNHTIGKLSGYNQGYFDGYLSDVYFIDGQALDPSNFGHADDNGVWQPIAYPGTYGTNGFHLEFADNSTAAALGTDTSGNGNDWTPSGVTTDDQVTDTPSVNYCTWNPLDLVSQTLSDGNLAVTYSANTAGVNATFAVSSGKWYWEWTAGDDTDVVGIWSSDSRCTSYPGTTADSYGYFGRDADLYNNGSPTSYGSTFAINDVIGLALDLDAGTLTFYKNNVSQGVAVSGLTGGWRPSVRAGNALNPSTGYANFGQQPFTYTPPTGFVALSSANLPTPTIADGKEHFDIALYTGDGGSQNVRGFEFQPDFVWVKERTTTEWHQLYDALRGTGALFSNETNVELTLSGISFLSNGFTASDTFRTNQRDLTYVGWAWNAGGSTVTNTDGTITSQVRANTDAGFSIVSYTGNGSAGATVGHGLSSAPEMVVVKGRNTALDWAIWHSAIGTTSYLVLNKTNAVSSPDPSVFNGLFSSSVFSIGNWSGINGNTNDYIAYCFAGVDGFSKFGSYTGNGSADGPFVYTGFRPAFVMMKAVSVNGEQWPIMDSKRLGYNVINNYLQASSTAAEFSYGGGGSDILSNGFKLRSTSTGLNGSGITFIYMAFAENPFKTARAR